MQSVVHIAHRLYNGFMNKILKSLLIVLFILACLFAYKVYLSETVKSDDASLIDDSNSLDLQDNGASVDSSTASNVLLSKPWSWESTIYNDGKIIEPKNDKFKITFNADNTFSASTDCNGLGGEYSISDRNITFSNMVSTMMYCEGSLEQEFSKSLSNTDSYMITEKGQLVMMIKYDSGSVIFK
jgi:heat shock protein HslJ